MALIEIFDTDDEQAQNVAENPAPKTTKPRSRTQKSTSGSAAKSTDPGGTAASRPATKSPAREAAPADAVPTEAENKPARKPRARKTSVPVESTLEPTSGKSTAENRSAELMESTPGKSTSGKNSAKPTSGRNSAKPISGRDSAKGANAPTFVEIDSTIPVNRAVYAILAPTSAAVVDSKTPREVLAKAFSNVLNNLENPPVEEKTKRTRRGGKGRKRAEAPVSEITESTEVIKTAEVTEATKVAEAAKVTEAAKDSETAVVEKAAPERNALSAYPEKIAIEAAPARVAIESSSRRTSLPVLTQYSPAPNAPTLILPQSASGNGNANGNSESNGVAAGAESDTPSKSRSRSARRRKAARKRAETAAATQSGGIGAAAQARTSGVSEVSGRVIFDAESDAVDGFDEQVPVRVAADLEFAELPETFDDADESTVLLLDESTSLLTEDTADASKSRRSRSRRGRGRKAGAAESATAAEVTDAADDIDLDLDADYDEDNEPVVQPRAERKMLVSVLPGELVEVVIVDEGKVQEYYVEMEHQAKIRGNIYKGVISNIDVNLQAAFVNYGNVKNGFLQIDEVHPEYWLTHHEVTKGHKYPPIQKVLKPGQEVLVQVVKEPSGAKGAFLTTWVSLAGRFLVLTPGQEQIGISRKVEDGEERNRLRELIKGLNPGEGLGAIVRTVSAGTSKTTLQKDLSFLKRVWKDIRKRAGSEKAPSLIYKEPSLATRAVRDYLSDDVSEVWVDDAETSEAIRDMTSLLFPRKADLLHLYQDNSKTLWERFKVRKDLDQIHARDVYLPSGGRLVFDQTEALMAIDINSGKTGGKTNFESMALRTNVEAAEMIAHQLRLRDVGGQVVIDFIEMRDQSHCREVEKTMRNAMKGDRARYDIGKMSSFGLMQIVRQRIGSSAISISQEACPHCCGTGLRRNMEWQSLQVLRDLRVQMRNTSIAGNTEFTLCLEGELAVYILNHKRERLCTLEKEFGVRLEVKVGLE